MIQPRCKICPDAIGQGADIAVHDAWLNGGPAVEDEALNSIIVRTKRGLELFDAAVEAGALEIKRETDIAEISELQSHQVRKRRAVWARLKGMAIAGRPGALCHRPRLAGMRFTQCAGREPGRGSWRPRPRPARPPGRAACRAAQDSPEG